jgi:lysophospholipase L1-like esterase
MRTHTLKETGALLAALVIGSTVFGSSAVWANPPKAGPTQLKPGDRIVAIRGKVPPIRKLDRVVFLGDSITQAGARPGGYVSLVRDKINAAHKDLGVEVIGAGISGHKVPDLQKRLDRDVISKKPTIVVIYIGINDVWHSTRNRGTPKDKFESGLLELIKRINTAGARVILATPSVIGEKPDGSNSLDKMLEEYSAISRKVAKATGSQLLDLRKQFIDHLKSSNADGKDRGILTSDTVHLNKAGNEFVAARMLEALGVNENSEKVLRHIVLFNFKKEVTDQQVQEVVEAFGKLPGKIDAILDYEAGTDVSVEGKAAGFTHAFLVTFRTAADRAVYLPHPAHKEFVSLVGPRIADVLVFDYWARE